MNPEKMASLFSFWHGKLTWMERTCLGSMVHMGHDVTLFSYAPDTLEDLPRGVRVENADAILALDAEADRILRVNPHMPIPSPPGFRRKAPLSQLNSGDGFGSRIASATV